MRKSKHMAKNFTNPSKNLNKALLISQQKVFTNVYIRLIEQYDLSRKSEIKQLQSELRVLSKRIKAV